MEHFSRGKIYIFINIFNEFKFLSDVKIKWRNFAKRGKDDKFLHV